MWFAVSESSVQGGLVLREKHHGRRLQCIKDEQCMVWRKQGTGTVPENKRPLIRHPR